MEKQAWTHDRLPSHAAGPPQPWSGWPGELGEPSAHGEPGELGEPGPLSLLGKAGLKKERKPLSFLTFWRKTSVSRKQFDTL